MVFELSVIRWGSAVREQVAIGDVCGEGHYLGVAGGIRSPEVGRPWFFA